MKRKILSMSDKQVVQWGPSGWVVFVTTEAKKLGWGRDDKVTVAAVEDEEGKAIVIRRAERKPTRSP
jgi:hypothetical protein